MFKFEAIKKGRPGAALRLNGLIYLGIAALRARLVALAGRTPFATGPVAFTTITAGPAEIRPISSAGSTGVWAVATTGPVTTAGTAKTATAKLRAQFVLIEFAVLVFVQRGKRLGCIFHFLSGDHAVLVRVNGRHQRTSRGTKPAESAPSAASTFTTTTAGPAFTGPTFVWTTAGPAFTGTTFAWTTARPAFAGSSSAKLGAEEFLHFLAGGTFVLIEPAVAVFVEFLQHSGAHSFAVKTAAATAFT
jgi:hypothetical protein